METINIFHNSKCSTCRRTLALIKERGFNVQLTSYLETPPKVAELRELTRKMGIRPKEMLRQKELPTHAPNLDVEDDELVLKTISETPVILQRPIVVRGERACIARPPESVLSLLE
jgi:arsenate reductase